jgi:hypothetical protein
VTVVYPEGTPTLGTISTRAVLSVTSLVAPKLATEINAATSVKADLYLFPAGWNPTGTTGKGTKPARLASKRDRQQLNRTSYELPDLQYIYDPQGDDSDPGNEMKEICVEGAKLYIVERRGPDAEDDVWVVGEKVRTHYIMLGPQIPMGDPSDENAEHFIQQSLVYINNGPVDGVIAT